jgi:G3E family GTPase
VILNKTDLVSGEQVQEVVNAVRDIAPHVTLLQTTFCQFPLEILESIRRSESIAEGVPGEGRPDPVESLTLTGQGSFSRQLWEEFMAAARPHCLRVKGFIFLERQPYHVDATPDTWTMEAATSPDSAIQQLVVIGQRLPHQHLNELFSQAI